MSQKVIVVSNHRLLNDILPLLRDEKEVKIRAKGSSMMPLIRDGIDSFILRQLKEDSLRVGNIVLALLEDGRYVLHRIASINGQDITLRGDGNPYQKEHCHKINILAEAFCVERNGQKRITKESLVWWFAQHLWPKNGFLRRLLLFILRQIQ